MPEPWPEDDGPFDCMPWRPPRKPGGKVINMHDYWNDDDYEEPPVQKDGKIFKKLTYRPNDGAEQVTFELRIVERKASRTDDLGELLYLVQEHDPVMMKIEGADPNEVIRKARAKFDAHFAIEWKVRHVVSLRQTKSSLNIGKEFNFKIVCADYEVGTDVNGNPVWRRPNCKDFPHQGTIEDALSTWNDRTDRHFIFTEDQEEEAKAHFDRINTEILSLFARESAGGLSGEAPPAKRPKKPAPEKKEPVKRKPGLKARLGR